MYYDFFFLPAGPKQLAAGWAGPGNSEQVGDTWTDTSYIIELDIYYLGGKKKRTEREREKGVENWGERQK